MRRRVRKRKMSYYRLLLRPRASWQLLKMKHQKCLQRKSSQSHLKQNPCLKSLQKSQRIQPLNPQRKRPHKSLIRRRQGWRRKRSLLEVSSLWRKSEEWQEARFKNLLRRPDFVVWSEKLQNLLPNKLKRNRKSKRPIRKRNERLSQRKRKKSW